MPETLPATIYTRLGSSNILLIVPHGYSASQDDNQNYLAELALTVADKLHCYAVVNTKYKKEIMDLSDLRALRVRPKVVQAFLEPIARFQREISGNGLIPLVLILQPLPVTESGPPMFLFGYGQGERGSIEAPHRPTIPASLLSKIRISFEDQNLTTELAATPSPHCARDEHHINQLFRQKILSEYYNPEVCSIVLHVQHDLLGQRVTALSIAELLAAALAPFTTSMSLVRNIDMDNIDTSTAEDLQYIFRLQGDSRYKELLRESYIDELAHSIDRNGLLHPLILLKKNNGHYKILCGYRRYQALKRLNRPQVEAKIYQESDFATEDFFNISLAENTKRRNLNPIEIGNFLESASTALGLNNAELAEQFGPTLGIGKPGQKVSHSTVHKYRKVNQIRIRGESPEIISDVVNERLQFSIAAEILAPMKNCKDRDALYTQIIQPLSPTRPQINQIIHLLLEISPQLSEAVVSERVAIAIEKASATAQPASTFLKALAVKEKNQPNTFQEGFDKKISALRCTFFGKQASKRDFNITPTIKGQHEEVIVQFRMRKGEILSTLERLNQAISQSDLFSETIPPESASSTLPTTE
jgi:ParB family chromosome partitioning protein